MLLAELPHWMAGQGTFTLTFDSYREVPGHLIEKIKVASPYRKETEATEE